MKNRIFESKEGDVIVMPLNDGGYGIGLIARKNMKIALGYFFRFISSDVPKNIQPSVLDKDNVILIAKFSSLRIDSGDWPIIGNPIPFVKTEWPIPIFKHKDDIVGVYRARVLKEDLFVAREYIISEDEASKLYQDGLYGAVALAIHLMGNWRSLERRENNGMGTNYLKSSLSSGLNMKKENVKAKEGELIAIPLKDGGYGVGLIARKNKSILLGYFFRYISPDVPNDLSPSVLDKDNVILIAQFGALDINSGAWPIIGNPIPFVKADWPIPIFRHQDAVTGKYLARVYPDDLSLFVREYLITEEEASRLYEDDLFGSGALASRLNRLLREYREAGK